MNTYNTYTPEGQNIQILNVEISSLEKKIKNKSIWLFILTGLAMIGTLVTASIIGFFHYAVIIDMLILIGLIIAGVLITRLNKTGFILAIVLLGIGGIIQIISVIMGAVELKVLGGLALRILLILFMVSGIKELDQLAALKAQYQQAVYAAQMRAQQESQAAYAQAPETQFPQ
jgi:hypothetical protein